MFTGIIDHLGEILAITRRDTSLSLQISTRFNDCRIGDSICVDGTCLTITACDKATLCFDISPETLAVTEIGSWAVGQSVHLEAALKVGDRLGGHWVTGHVDSCVQVDALRKDGDCLYVHFTGLASEHISYVVDKGSVALAGVSLTINKVDAAGFSVMLIPHTLSVTNFSELTVGMLLPVEYDYLIKWAARQHTITGSV